MGANATNEGGGDKDDIIKYATERNNKVMLCVGKNNQVEWL